MAYINRRFMNEKSVLNALTSTLILAAGADVYKRQALLCRASRGKHSRRDSTQRKANMSINLLIARNVICCCRTIHFPEEDAPCVVGRGIVPSSGSVR